MSTNYDYQNYLIQEELKYSRSRVIKRVERISKNFSETGLEFNYSSYALLVREQQKTNPEYPKVEDGLLPNKLQTFSSQLLAEATFGPFDFVGIKKINHIDHYEFADHLKPDYKNYRYIYIPCSPTNKEHLKPKLPFLLNWELNQVDYLTLETNHYLEYPATSNLILNPASIWNDYIEVLTQDCSHPFLPNFFFTGRLLVQSNGNILYEYFDEVGYSSFRDLPLVSNLQPINLDFPLGQPRAGDLQIDDCLLSKVDLFPSKGNTNYIGRFKCFTTTEIYHKTIKFYLYEREDGSVFLSKYPPHSFAREYIEEVLILNKIIKPQIILEDSPGVQTFTIKQSTTNSEIILHE